MVLVSCSDNHFRRFDILPEDQRWYITDKKIYEFEIEDGSRPYNLVFQFSHVYDYQFSTIPLNIDIEGPDGKTEALEIVLHVRDNSGRQLADCSGDVCDLFYKISENKKLQKGNYKVTISHSFDGPYLPNVIGVGLAVENVR
jgi:gliding motility-associated lipoprotein GldH